MQTLAVVVLCGVVSTAFAIVVLALTCRGHPADPGTGALVLR
jgi:hypothetical protein